MKIENTCIAAWQGGINFTMQYAARHDGELFMRFQDRGRWGKWNPAKKWIDPLNPPSTIPAGFGTARRPDQYTCIGWQRWRLPKPLLTDTVRTKPYAEIR